MRNKQDQLVVLVAMALLFLCVHSLSATSTSIGRGRGRGGGRVDEERGRAIIIIGEVNKFSHGSYTGRGGNGGHPVVSGDSHSPNVQGGGGMTPLYAAAAGAGNNRHPHRGGGNHAKGGVGLETMAITTFAWFILCTM